MKKILFIAPHFMGYDEEICKGFGSKWDVTYVDSEQYLASVRLKYKQKNMAIKVLLKIFSPFRDLYRDKMLNSYFAIKNENWMKSKCFDTVFIINGDGIPNSVYNRIKSNNPDANFILYIWDDLKCLFKKNHLHYFDNIFSYNIDDCRKYNYEYLPVFTRPINQEKQEELIYDIAIVATANKDRIKFIKKLYKKYKNIYKFYIYFYDKELKYDFFSFSTPLSFDSYLGILQKSKAVFEVPRHGQKGPTTRMFDALETATKVITTNKHIKKYPVYNDKNICVIKWNCTIPKMFILDGYDSSNKPMYINEWLCHLNIESEEV